MKDIVIQNRIIGVNHKPFIIAEMSGNHNQSLDKALEIVREAYRCGADAVKLQTYTPDTMTINSTGGLFTITDKDSLWYGRDLYELYGEAYTPWEWHQQIFDLANELGIIIFSTPFDETSVDFLESLNVPAYKIASFENTDWPLLKKVAKTKKPVIISLGGATLSNISESISVLRENGCEDLIVLKCTSTYPATPETTNLKTIPHLRDMFDCHVGLSDHTLGVGVAIASVSLGVSVIEKHFTLDRSEGGVDSAFSIEPAELKYLVEETAKVHDALGVINYGILDSEKSSLRFKRSIYVVEDINEGEILTKENIKIIRPGDGLETKYFDIVLGKKAKFPISKGSPLSWDMI
jgi:pseudaminic acid synthase